MPHVVVIYTKPNCPYCQRAKALLTQKQVSYQEIDVLEHTAMFQEIKDKYHVKTIPQIFIGSLHVGGCDQLIQLDKEGKLNTLLGVA